MKRRRFRLLVRRPDDLFSAFARAPTSYFAAVSGSSAATVRVGYSQVFATGVIVNAGTLGILIPSPIVLVVYAAPTEVSVGHLFRRAATIHSAIPCAHLC